MGTETRVGFIGTGIIATSHMRNLAQMDGVRIAALCDVSPENLARAQRTFGGNGYASHVEMLEREKLDCVYVCIPPFAHSGQELDVLERGIPLFVEKPVTLDLGLGRRIAAEIERRQVVSCCGYHWRYYDTVDRARDLVQEHRIGLVLGQWLGGIWKAPWWKVKELSGGQMVEQTTHMFDLARYLVGDVVSVSALGFRGLVDDVEGYTLDDASVVNLRFALGAVGNISSSCVLGRGGRSGLTLIGRNLIIEISPTSLRVGDREKVTEYTPTVPALEAEDQAWIEAVRTGDGSKLRSTYADALKTVAVTLTATRSLQQNGEWLTVEV